MPACLAGDRNVFEIAQRGHGVLRRLRHHAVAHSVLRIEPERRRGLKAAAQRDQQAVGDIELREAALHGLGAIHVDVDAGLIEELVDAQIDGARDALEAGPEDWWRTRGWPRRSGPDT